MRLPLLGPVSLAGFQNAWFFLFLLIVLLMVGIYVAQQYARRRRVLRFANMEVLQRVAPSRLSRWRHVPTILLATSLVLLTTAMAGPTSNVRITLNRAVVMLVIDVSESMASYDVTPSRLAAAKVAGKQFADELTPAINLGLVAFAANATLLVAPTTNRVAVKAAIEALQGAFTAARAAKTQGVQISTISFGTPYGTVEYNGTNIPVPVDDQTLQKI